MNTHNFLNLHKADVGSLDHLLLIRILVVFGIDKDIPLVADLAWDMRLP
ncbi:MAG: hypothetical protein P8175_00210 [Deltaproteobacteria bacterium]